MDHANHAESFFGRPDFFYEHCAPMLLKSYHLKIVWKHFGDILSGFVLASYLQLRAQILHCQFICFFLIVNLNKFEGVYQNKSSRCGHFVSSLDERDYLSREIFVMASKTLSISSWVLNGPKLNRTPPSGLVPRSS